VQACDFDYRIISQNPSDQTFIPANTDFERDITLINAGTCAWDRNTSLVFEEGESFSASPPYIFIRERVEVGQEVTITFEGRAPQRGGTYSSTWRLYTPGLIPIGSEAINISAQVFEGG
jgi:hypothetical protein